MRCHCRRVFPHRHYLAAANVMVVTLALLLPGLCAADERVEETQAAEKLALLGARVIRDYKLPNKPVTAVRF